MRPRRLAPRLLKPKMGGGRGTTTSAPSTLNDDIIAFWPLDEASGTRADSVGSNDLTDNNTVEQVAGKIGNAAGFTRASSNFLSIAHNADLVSADKDFQFAGWFYLKNKTATYPLFGKGLGGDTSSLNWEYAAVYSQSVDRLRWAFWPDGAGAATVVAADNFGSPTAETYYFIEVWFDSVNNLIGIRINNGTANTAAFTATPETTTHAFHIGRDAAGAEYGDIQVDALGKWDRILTAAESTELFNGGAGKEYPF